MPSQTKITLEADGEISHTSPIQLIGHSGTVRCVEWCDSFGPSSIISAGAGDCAVRLWDFSRKSCLAMLQGHSDHVQVDPPCPPLFLSRSSPLTLLPLSLHSPSLSPSLSHSFSLPLSPSLSLFLSLPLPLPLPFPLSYPLAGSR
eukprot:765784-Hanusia_phi.AAC.3